jgi:quinoprotein dehydrogenase-associated probable ABC transporter substrate-binding protein
MNFALSRLASLRRSLAAAQWPPHCAIARLRECAISRRPFSLKNRAIAHSRIRAMEGRGRVPGAECREGRFEFGRKTRVAFSVFLLLVSAAPLRSANPAPPRHPAPLVSREKKEIRAGSRILRICADPNNLPFSNKNEEGFENRIADLIADDLNATVEYTWWAQRRGFVRNTLRANSCDVVMGIPSSFELALPTAPYYRSTYVFVTRKDRGLDIRSFEDPGLRTLQIGVHLIGDDGANTPPAHALSRRGIIDNVHGYPIYGDYSKPNPPARILDDVASGVIDVAVVWGPLAGFFASRQRVPLEIVPVSPQIDVPFLPFVFDIALGVRRDDVELKAELEGILARRHADIARILDEYRVPRVGRRK